MKKIIIGVVVLSLLSQRAFTQVQIITPQLTPWDAAQAATAPFANAVQNYGQQNYDTATMMAQQAFATQQQMQAAAQEEAGYPATTVTDAFSKFYQDRAGASITNALPYSGDTKIFTSSNTTNDIKNLQRDNYRLIGFSAFQGTQQSQDAVMVQANKVGADVVLLTSTFLGSQRVTDGRYVDRYKCEADFLEK